MSKAQKLQNMKVLGRWRKLIKGIQSKDTKEQKYKKIRNMMLDAKWRNLAIKSLKR